MYSFKFKIFKKIMIKETKKKSFTRLVSNKISFIPTKTNNDDSQPRTESETL